MFFRKLKLERQLMDEIKKYADVTEFPNNDAKVIADFLSSYDQGKERVMLAALSASNTIAKYPNLYRNWDNIMIKYKKLGLFKNWDIRLD